MALPSSRGADPVRAALAGDGHRPQYHYQPPANWMNDPNGLIEWAGRYHLFYQYNPHGPFHDAIHWGHAVSADLVHWQDLPVALHPTPGGPDADGCWSGCAVDDDGVPTLVYTGVFPQTVCLAVGSPDLLTWRPVAENPVLAGPPPELAAASGGHFRDPYVWRETDGWYMLIGCKDEGVGGLLLLYRSDDLRQWHYLHPFLAGDAARTDPLWTGTMWECPNYLDFGAQKCVIFSVQATPTDMLHPVYYVGRARDWHFEPAGAGILVHGGCFYAPQVMRAGDGRYLMWGWLREGRLQAQSNAAGWAGVMSLPLVVSLLDGRPRLAPAAELARLRGAAWHYDERQVAAGVAIVLPEVRGAQLEIQVEFVVDAAGEAGLSVRRSPDGQEQTNIVYRPGAGQLVIERQNASIRSGVDRVDCHAPLSLAAGERLALRVFVDGSVVTVLANEQVCLVGRIYPARPDSLGVALLARSGHAKILSLDIWPMKSIWA